MMYGHSKQRCRVTSRTFGTLESGESNSKEVKFDFTQREDVQTSRYTLNSRLRQTDRKKQKSSSM